MHYITQEHACLRVGVASSRVTLFDAREEYLGNKLVGQAGTFTRFLWDLFEPRRLFSPHDSNRRYSEHLHLAQMVSILGPPPLDFLQRSEKSKLFWDEEGS